MSAAGRRAPVRNPKAEAIRARARALSANIGRATCSGTEPHPFVSEFIWTAERNRFGWSSLLGYAPGEPDVSPHAAPARASEVDRLPPTFIAVGGLDLFPEENLAYAARLSRAGVPVEFHLYPGAFQGFLHEPNARVTQAANRDSRDALRRRMYL